MNWHYVENAQNVGPVTEEQLQQLFQSGRINGSTLVWREGLPDWISYEQAMAGQQAPPPGFQPQGEPQVVCAECGKVLPASETVRFGQANVCAACKPIYLQKMSEGARLINTGELNYAGFWIRFAAKFIDGLIIGLPMFIVMFAIMIPSMNNSSPGNPPVVLAFLPYLLQLAFVGVNICYQIFFLGKYGATLGKMACKLKVVTADGSDITYGRATGRAFSEILSRWTCGIGYIIAAFDVQKRALHDHICTTRVIYK